MTNLGIAYLRQHNQLINRHPFQKPEEVVQWLGAVQAQEYPDSLWAIGLRIPNITEAGIERAIAGRTILRTWPMRGTIHYVPPANAAGCSSSSRRVVAVCRRTGHLDCDGCFHEAAKPL
jgi:hypothetical protein